MKIPSILTLLASALALSSVTICPVMAQGASHKGNHDSMKMMHSRYGGPTYTGGPALEVTASLVEAGGGAENYSTATALTAMVGEKAVGAEVAKLTKQYGKKKVASWLTVFDFAVKDALAIATKAGVTLPAGTLSGKDLAVTLVKAGLGNKNVFYVEFMLDKAVTHNIHETVMDDINKKYGAKADADYHRITNQAMYDLAHALGAKEVKLAPFH